MPDDHACQPQGAERPWPAAIKAGKGTQRANVFNQHVKHGDPGHGAHGRHDADALCSGKHNAAGFLDDPTGHRRFMCVTLEGIDWDYTKAVQADQVWAQARQAYAAGEAWELKGLELEMSEEANTGFEVSDPLEDLIFRRFVFTGDNNDFVPTIDILDKLHLDGWRLRTPRQETMEIGGLLRKLGLVATRCRWQGSCRSAVSTLGDT